MQVFATINNMKLIAMGTLDLKLYFFLFVSDNFFGMFSKNLNHWANGHYILRVSGADCQFASQKRRVLVDSHTSYRSPLVSKLCFQRLKLNNNDNNKITY